MLDYTMNCKRYKNSICLNHSLSLGLQKAGLINQIAELNDTIIQLQGLLLRKFYD